MQARPGSFFINSAVLGGIVFLALIRALALDQVRDAATAFAHGDTASAESILHNVLTQNPRDVDALSLLGVVLDSEKKYDEALAAYQSALKISPASPSLLNNFGNHLLAIGDTSAARTAFLKVVAVRPNHPNANLQLASIAVENKKGAECLRHLDRLPAAERAAPEIMLLRMRALYLSGRATEADAIAATLADAASRDPRLAFSTGLALAEAKNYAQAEAFFEITLKLVPGNFDALYNLGIAAFHAHHLDRAHEALQTALNQKPQDVDTLYNLAVVEIEQKQRQAAVSLLAQAARIDPSRANVQLTLADTLSALGYYADALNTYGNYLKLVPNNLTAEREHAFMLAICRREEGLPVVQAIVRQRPRDAVAHYELAVLEANTDTVDASAQLETALALKPDFVAARFGRGVLKYLLGQFSAAVPDLEFAAEHDPDNANVLDRLGKTYMELGRYDDAVRTLRRAVQIDDKDARTFFHLSRALSATGRKDEARSALEHFWSLGSEQIGRIPPPGFVDLLGLPPEQLYAQYRAEVEKRAAEDPDDPGVKIRYLKLLLDDGKTNDALSLARGILASKPRGWLAAEAGRALLDAGQYADARPLLEYTVQAAPASDSRVDLAVTIFHTEGAAAALSELDKVAPPQRTGDYFLARAQLLDTLGRSDEALTDVQHALAVGPARASFYQDACMLLLKHQRYEDAIKLTDQAARAQPRDREILLLQAGVLAAAQQTSKAEDLLRKIEDQWPEWAQPHVTYGVLLQGLKRSEEARTQLETAVALGASSAQVFYYLAKATLSAAPDHLDDAMKAINHAVALQPNDAMIQELAGKISYQQHDYINAAEHLEAAVRLRPTLLQARYTLNQTYKAMGRDQDAAHEMDEIQRLRAQNQLVDEEDAGAGLQPH